jgi:hypothetical protein
MEYADDMIEVKMYFIFSSGLADSQAFLRK